MFRAELQPEAFNDSIRGLGPLVEELARDDTKPDNVEMGHRDVESSEVIQNIAISFLVADAAILAMKTAFLAWETKLLFTHRQPDLNYVLAGPDGDRTVTIRNQEEMVKLIEDIKRGSYDSVIVRYGKQK